MPGIAKERAGQAAPPRRYGIASGLPKKNWPRKFVTGLYHFSARDQTGKGGTKDP